MQRGLLNCNAIYLRFKADTGPSLMKGVDVDGLRKVSHLCVVWVWFLWALDTKRIATLLPAKQQ